MKALTKIVVMVVVASVFAGASQPVMFGLNGRASSAGSPISGSLWVNVTSESNCHDGGGGVYSKGFPNAIADGEFHVMLGENDELRLDYGRDYWLCTYANGVRLGNGTKFKAGQGEISTLNPVSKMTIAPIGGRTDVIGSLNATGGATIGNGYFGPWNANANYLAISTGGNERNSTAYALLVRDDGKDNSTHINAPGGSNIYMRINNADVMTISKNGNVGIGVNNPAYKLEVNGRARFTAGIDSSAGAWYTDRANNSLKSFIGRGTDTDSFTGVYVVGLGWIMALKDTGNLGLGTTAPTKRLDVTGTTGATLYASNAVSDAISSGTNWLRAPKNTVSVFLGNNDATSNYTSSDYSGDIRFNGAAIAWGDLAYYPNGEATYGSFRLSRAGSSVVTTPNAKLGVGSLYSAGKIGVGTTTPNATLDVVGSIDSFTTDSEYIGFNLNYNTVNAKCVTGSLNRFTKTKSTTPGATGASLCGSINKTCTNVTVWYATTASTTFNNYQAPTNPTNCNTKLVSTATAPWPYSNLGNNEGNDTYNWRHYTYGVCCS